MKKRYIGRQLHRIDLLTCLHLRNAGDDLIPPGQMRALEFIQAHPGCSQADVAAELQVSPAAIAQSIKRMDASEFIERDTQKGNLRANSLHITEKGILASEKCREVFNSMNERMLFGFSEEERDTVSSMLARMVHNLESSVTDGMNNMELSELIRRKCDGDLSKGEKARKGEISDD